MFKGSHAAPSPDGEPYYSESLERWVPADGILYPEYESRLEAQKRHGEKFWKAVEAMGSLTDDMLDKPVKLVIDTDRLP